MTIAAPIPAGATMIEDILSITIPNKISSIGTFPPINIAWKDTCNSVQTTTFTGVIQVLEPVSECTKTTEPDTTNPNGFAEARPSAQRTIRMR
jgi:hypothetical protein